MERQGQPTSAGEGGGRNAVCSACSPLMYPGDSIREEAGARCPRQPRCGSSAPVADNRSCSRGRRVEAQGWPATSSLVGTSTLTPYHHPGAGYWELCD